MSSALPGFSCYYFLCRWPLNIILSLFTGQSAVWEAELGIFGIRDIRWELDFRSSRGVAGSEKSLTVAF